MIELPVYRVSCRLTVNCPHTVNRKLQTANRKSEGRNLQADVNGGGRMRDRADRDQIDAALGDAAHGFQSDAARRFDQDGGSLFTDQLHGSAHLGGRHVVEHDDVGAGLQSIAQLRVASDFNFDAHQVRHAAAGQLDGATYAAGQGDVVVFDEHAIIQPEAVVEAAADRHRVLFKSAQSGRRLARVNDLCASAFDGVNITFCKRRDTGQPLQKVERRALAHQQNVGGAFDARELGAGSDGVAVKGPRLDLYLTIERRKDRFDNLQAAEREVLLGEEATAPRLAAAHRRRRRDV